MAAAGSGVPRAELVHELARLQLSGKTAGEFDDLAMALAPACWRARVR